MAGAPYTCNGATDSVTKSWATTAPESTTLQNLTNATDGKAQTVTEVALATAQAAQFCNNINTNGYGGYSDWYLPARQELSVLYQQSPAIGGFSYSSFYWSSTEYNTTNAWNFYFNTGYLNVSTKTTAYYVRCVRRF